MTGYFAAPGARLYPLSHRKSRRPKPLPPVTLVFCAIDGYHEIMAENHVYGELATGQCYTVCRQLLKDRNGYECGAEEGTFLAAFSSGTEALQFCVVVSFLIQCSIELDPACPCCSGSELPALLSPVGIVRSVPNAVIVSKSSTWLIAMLAAVHLYKTFRICTVYAELIL